MTGSHLKDRPKLAMVTTLGAVSKLQSAFRGDLLRGMDRGQLGGVGCALIGGV